MKTPNSRPVSTNAQKARLKRADERNKKKLKKERQAKGIPNRANFAGGIGLSGDSGIYQLRTTINQVIALDSSALSCAFVLSESSHSDVGDGAKRYFPTNVFPAVAFKQRKLSKAIDVILSVIEQGSRLAELPMQEERQGGRQERQMRARSALADAEDSLDLASEVRELLAQDVPKPADLARAFCIFYYLGRLAERQEVRQFEHLVVRAKDDIERGKEAAAAANSHFNETSDIAEQARRKVAKHMKAGLTYSASVTAAAGELGIDRRTVKKRTAPLDPRNAPDGDDDFGE